MKFRNNICRLLNPAPHPSGAQHKDQEPVPSLSIYEKIRRGRAYMIEAHEQRPPDNEAGCKVWTGTFQYGEPWSDKFDMPVRSLIAGVPRGEEWVHEMTCDTPGCCAPEHVVPVDWYEVRSRRGAEKMQEHFARVREAGRERREAARQPDPRRAAARQSDQRRTLNDEHRSRVHTLIAELNVTRVAENLPPIRFPRVDT